MNNADLAINAVRQFQSSLFDPAKSTNDLFKETTEIIKILENASKEIRINYDDISDKLTKQLNTGIKQ
jgi:hypothetical protein